MSLAISDVILYALELYTRGCMHMRKYHIGRYHRRSSYNKHCTHNKNKINDIARNVPIIIINIIQYGP